VSATRRLLPLLAATLPWSASACSDGRSEAAAPFFWKPARAAEWFESCGDARRGVALLAGEAVEFELPAPRAAAWLDVAVAALPTGATPPPAARLIVERVVGGKATLLYDGIPRAGLPSAFGWGEERIELRDALDASSTLRFRVAPQADVERFALALPRVASRATASDRGAATIEWSATLPAGVAPPDGATIERLLAPFAKAYGESRTSSSPPDLESLAFGWGEAPPAAPFDRVIRFDPLPRSDLAAALPSLAAWGEPLLQERRRLLGEHLLFEALARPRHSPLRVVVATRSSDAAGALAALQRLLDHLRANELADQVAVRVAFPSSP